VQPGHPAVDAPLGEGWLLDRLGRGFVLLSFGEVSSTLPTVVADGDVLAQRYDGRPGTCYLIRPDQYVAARWRQFDAAKVEAALQRSLGRTVTPAKAAIQHPSPLPTALDASLRPPAAPLNRQPNLPDPDGFYDELIASQRGQCDEQADALLARLVLILANHIGDRAVLRDALALARDNSTAQQVQQP
jgi:3-(3-hydroxy-phenyl)propionate hydroxylase